MSRRTVRRLLVVAVALLASAAAAITVVAHAKVRALPLPKRAAAAPTGSATSPARAIAPVSLAPVDPQLLAAIDAYRHGLDAWIAAAAVPDPFAPAVQSTTTGDVRTRALDSIIVLEHRGDALRGTVQAIDSPQVVSSTPTEVVLKVCELDTSYVITAATGEPTAVPGLFPPGSPPHYLGATVTVDLTDGAWKLASRMGQYSTNKDVACPLGY